MRHLVFARCLAGVVPQRARVALGVGFLFLLLTTLPASGAEPDYRIIVNANNPTTSLSRAEVDAIFLGKIRQWPSGVEVHVISHQDESMREQFAQSVHSRPDAAVSAYWAAKAFKDATPPPAKLGDGEIVNYVANEPGAIGFVRVETPLDGVKRLRVAD